MATFVNDTFTDTNGTDLSSHTPDGGGSWTRHGSYANALQVQGNRCRATGATAYYHSGAPATAEYDVQADYVATTGTPDNALGVLGRVNTAANTFYMLRYIGAGTDQWQLFKAVAGTFTSLGTYSQSITAATYQIKLEIRDATKKCFVAGVERISSVDNAITSSGRAGIREGAASAYTEGELDNFSAVDASAGEVSITPDDATHSHTAESPTVTQVHAISPADATHSHTAESPTITQVHAISPADATHGHTAESPAITQVHAISPSDATHAHTAESPTLTQVHSLAPDDATHGHTAESPSITQVHVLVPGDALHAHAAESPTITQVHSLSPGDALHAHSAESPAITQVHVLVPADCLHAHTAESPTVAEGAVVFPDDALHAHSVESPAITQIHVLVPADALHAHSAESPAITQIHVIAPADALHAHYAESPSVTLVTPGSDAFLVGTVSVYPTLAGRISTYCALSGKVTLNR